MELPTHDQLLPHVRNRVNELTDAIRKVIFCAGDIIPADTRLAVEAFITVQTSMHCDVLAEQSQGLWAPFIYELLEINKKVIVDYSVLETELVETARAIIHLFLESTRLVTALNALYAAKHGTKYVDCYKVTGTGKDAVVSSVDKTFEGGSASKILVDADYLAEMDKIREKYPTSAISRIREWCKLFPERVALAGGIVVGDATAAFIPQDQAGALDGLDQCENIWQRLDLLMDQGPLQENFIKPLIAAALANPDFPVRLRKPLEAFLAEFPPPPEPVFETVDLTADETGSEPEEQNPDETPEASQSPQEPVSSDNPHLQDLDTELPPSRRGDLETPHSKRRKTAEN